MLNLGEYAEEQTGFSPEPKVKIPRVILRMKYPLAVACGSELANTSTPSALKDVTLQLLNVRKDLNRAPGLSVPRSGAS